MFQLLMNRPLLIVLNEDVVKTRVQTWDVVARCQASSIESATQPLLNAEQVPSSGRQSSFVRPSALQIAKEAYTAEGISVFFRGLGICSARAFLVNAVQWAVRLSMHSTQYKTFTDNMITGVRMDDEATSSLMYATYSHAQRRGQLSVCTFRS